jgi:hypothetical protein
LDMESALPGPKLSDTNDPHKQWKTCRIRRAARRPN